MSIDFTKEEFRALLDLISLGEWVIRAHDTENDPAKDIYEAAVQKIFSRAEEYGYGDLVVFDESFGRFFETGDYENSVKEEYLDAYNSNTFWDELISRLAERDFEGEHSPEQIQKMSPEEHLRKLFEHEMKYAEEFEVYGIDRVLLDDH